jgi:cytochrome b
MNARNEVLVWDPLVRVFHWSLVASFTIAYLSGEGWEGLHTWAGYTVAGLIAVRLVWGFVGTRYARFSDFVRGPGAVMDYLKELRRLDAPRHLGHNPAGGAMIVALLLLVVLTALSGVALLGAEEGAGPLAGVMAHTAHFWEEALEETHEVLANLTVLLVVLHVTGVVLSSFLHNENLVRAMVTGRKRADG